MKDRQLKLSDYLIIASLIFGMFFGAGNLIFPVHLGQLADGNWITAALGFLLSGVCIPLLAILAISATKSGGIYDLAKPVSPRYALIFLILVHATLEPLFAAPRTATVSYALGIALVHVALIFLGATSLSRFKLADNGGVTLTQISRYYLGNLGNVLLTLLATVGCLTTAMGLVIAFAQDFHQRFSRFSYKQFLIAFCLF